MKKAIIILALFFIISISVYVIYTINHPKIAVLCYHNIGTREEINKFPEEKEWTIDINNFEEHLKILKRYNYKALTLEEFYNWKQGKKKLPYKSVLITFDDGFLSNYEYAFKLLQEYDMNATVFLIGNYMKENSEEWRGNLKTYMSKEDLEEAQKKYPNIEFASHSFDLHEHGLIDIKNYDEFLEDGKNFNKNIINTDFYCYPFGAYNDDMIQALKDNNYKMAFIFGPTKMEYRKAKNADNDYLIPRLNVSYGMKAEKFFLRLLLPN